jgi:hypothetical protein
MKKLFIVLVSIAFFVTANTNAQVSVNVNFGTPPVWAPADRVEVQYYYLPEIDVYYDVPQRQYIYLSKSKWIRSGNLPSRYSYYKLRGGNIVYLTDYRGNSPYAFHKNHRIKYYHPVKKEKIIVVKHNENNEHHNNGNHKGKGKKKHGRD